MHPSSTTRFLSFSFLFSIFFISFFVASFSIFLIVPCPLASFPSVSLSTSHPFPISLSSSSVPLFFSCSCVFPFALGAPYHENDTACSHKKPSASLLTFQSQSAFELRHNRWPWCARIHPHLQTQEQQANHSRVSSHCFLTMVMFTEAALRDARLAQRDQMFLAQSRPCCCCHIQLWQAPSRI